MGGRFPQVVQRAGPGTRQRTAARMRCVESVGVGNLGHGRERRRMHMHIHTSRQSAAGLARLPVAVPRSAVAGVSPDRRACRRAHAPNLVRFAGFADSIADAVDSNLQSCNRGLPCV